MERMKDVEDSIVQYLDVKGRRRTSDQIATDLGLTVTQVENALDHLWSTDRVRRVWYRYDCDRWEVHCE